MCGLGTRKVGVNLHPTGTAEPQSLCRRDAESALSALEAQLAIYSVSVSAGCCVKEGVYCKKRVCVTCQGTYMSKGGCARVCMAGGGLYVI